MSVDGDICRWLDDIEPELGQKWIDTASVKGEAAIEAAEQAFDDAIDGLDPVKRAEFEQCMTSRNEWLWL